MKNNNYIVVHGWMTNELMLKGNELMIYALIHGFSQDGETEYGGGNKFIRETLNISRRTAVYALKELSEKGLIVNCPANINGVTLNRYKTVIPEIAQGVQKLHRGGAEIAHNRNTNKKDNITNQLADRKIKFANELKNKDYPREMLLDFFSYWIEENRSGTKMRFELERTWNMDSRLRTWARRDKRFQAKEKKSTAQKKKSLQQKMREQYGLD